VPALVQARRPVRWAITAVSLILAVGSVGFLAYPLATDVLQHRLQRRLAADLRRPGATDSYRAGAVAEGTGLTRLRIPDIGVDVVVVEGTGRSALRAGAGHYPSTPLPGQEGNVAIAGHRTTYGKPFANLDHLRPGAVISLETPVGTFAYRVSREPFVVAGTDRSVIGPSTGRVLTLTTCHPKGSARRRLVVRAELVAAPGPG
jgi:sortase A